MLPDMKSVWPVIVCCDLDGQPYAIANILNKRVSCPIITFSNAMRNNELCVCVDAAPQPEIAAFFLWIYQPASMGADKLPLLIHFDSDARQITKVYVHVICKRFASLTNYAKNSVFTRLEHAR